MVYFHGGNEYVPFPAPVKKELYRHFIDIGAGAVVAMHTHCPQGYETYRDAPIIYSMGNFFFPVAKPWRPIWHYGYMSALTFEGGKIGVEFTPYRQDFEGIHIFKGAELEHFERYFKAICAPIQDDELLQHYYDAWCIYRNYLSKLINHNNGLDGGLPALKNMLGCEAHNDVLRNGIRLLFEGAPDNVAQLTKDIETLQEFEIPESLAQRGKK